MKTLNFIVMDDDQRYAEHLVERLSSYFDDVNLAFMDEKVEFVRALRQPWDVIVYHKAYDLELPELVALAGEHGVAVLVLGNSLDMITGRLVNAIPREDAQVVLAICLQAHYTQAMRELSNLKGVLKDSEQRASILIKNSKSAVAYIDQGVHVFANDAYLELFGYSSIEAIIGVPVVDLIKGSDNIKSFKQFLRRFDKGERGDVEFDFESIRTDGSTFAAKLQLASATLDGEPVVQVIIQHNDNAAELAARLEEMKSTDELTGLASRAGFEARFGEVFAEAQAGERAALMYIRVDNIGKLSSAYGVSGMDAIIRQVAFALDEGIDGFVARFGESAFAALVQNQNLDAVEKIADEVRTRIGNMLIELGKRTAQVSISVAVVMIDRTTPSEAVALDRALDLMNQIYVDTEGAGNVVRVFDIKQYAAEDEDALGEYVASALSSNTFELYYQPSYDTQTDQSELYQVYVRLPSEDGYIGADKFLPAAKKRDLLGKLDRWTLINAAKALAAAKQDQPNARLCVTLSATSLADNNLPAIMQQLAGAVGSGIGAITVQFDENDLVDYLAIAKRQFLALQKIGCPVGVHNFGNTAKSDELVKHLTPAIVRLDKSYTKDLDREENMQTVQGLVAAAQASGADALMAYIADAQTMSLAWSVGARYLQGDYLQPATAQIAVEG